MNSRQTRHGRRGASFMRSWKYRFLLIGISVITACLVVLAAKSLVTTGPRSDLQGEPAAAALPTASPVPVKREALAFHMEDFDRGWVRYTDGVKITEDGGAHWRDAAEGETGEAAFARTAQAAAEGGAGEPDSGEDAQNAAVNQREAAADKAGPGQAAGGTLPAAGAESASTDSASPGAKPDAGAETRAELTTVEYASKPYPVKQQQFLSELIGWALITNSDEPLLVTADGGQSWSAEVTPEIRAVMLREKERLQKLQSEAALYSDAETADKAVHSKWTLMPDRAARGDAVLVRHDEPGEVSWQGRTYKLQPFGAGYFTYLPISMQTKAGTYPIGDQTLTIVEKKFETQYLQVTKQMESMRQDTERIQADQKKIDKARSQSEPAFLFTGPFVKPVEGILTTPYGYTRYVNGKYDSSHMAMDLAADEGTPVKATNDGVVVLADSLYLTGNSIYIDHGMGLFSQYAHLSELRVKAGDHVKQGDIIGLVGTTGFSTGPHLHFTFWVHNVQANPELFFNTTPFHWLKKPS